MTTVIDFTRVAVAPVALDVLVVGVDFGGTPRLRKWVVANSALVVGLIIHCEWKHAGLISLRAVFSKGCFCAANGSSCRGQQQKGNKDQRRGTLHRGKAEMKLSRKQLSTIERQRRLIKNKLSRTGS